MRPIIFITERTRHLLRSRNCDCRSSDDLYPVLCKIKTDFLTSKSQSFKQKRLDKKQAFQPVPYLAYHFRRMICPPSKQRYFSIGIISCQLKNPGGNSGILACGVSEKRKSTGTKIPMLFFWRRKRDLNPRDTFAPYSLSRGAPSPLGYFSKG